MIAAYGRQNPAPAELVLEQMDAFFWVSAKPNRIAQTNDFFDVATLKLVQNGLECLGVAVNVRNNPNAQCLCSPLLILILMAS